jgi:hypothetical protein
MSMVSGGRGRSAIVTLPRRFVPQPPPVSAERFSGIITMAILLLVLPLFAQSFYYLHELTVPYFLSKAWPIITLPLSLYAVVYLRLPAKLFYLVFLTYAIGFTPFISMVHLGNGLIDAMITTVKVWPLSYYFALSALLVWLSPSYERVRLALIVLGLTTFGLMLLLWIVIPQAWYLNNPELGKLFMIEDERGYRIYMPMYFGALLIFFMVRSFMHKPHWLPVVIVVVAFVLMLSIYKQRTAIGAMFIVSAYAVVVSLPPRIRRAVLGLFLVIVPLGLGYLVIENSQNFAESLGGSLTVRQTSLALAANYLGDNPWRWLFGVGATTRFSTITLSDIFGNAQFYIADLGWLGVVFEYGILGALLLAGLYCWGLYVVLRTTGAQRDPIVLALSDYILFMLVTSAVYSLVFTPGEFGISMALAVYLAREKGRAVSTPPPAHSISFAPATRHNIRT